MVIGIAAVDQDVALLKPVGELLDRLIHDRRRDHQPDRPGGWSFSINSSRVLAAVAPSLTSGADASVWTS